MQTAIQLYTVRERDAPLTEILADVGAAGYDGVEFAHRVSEADAAAVRDALDDAGLTAASAHVGVDELESDFAGVVERADVLGYDDVVVPWLDPEHWETVAAVEATADRLAALASDLAAEGLTLHYHNHDQEFVETEAGTAFHVFAERAPDVTLEVDAGWALAGGADPAELLRRYGDRISHVHLKDVHLDSDEVPALGEGDLDIPAVVEAARDVGAEWLIYENDQPRDPEAAIPHGASVLADVA